MKRCTKLADVIVSGDAMSDDDRAHLATCADCTGLAAMPRLVAATAVAPEPGPGFASRVTAHARERMASRRRQRVAGFGLATVCAAGAAFMIIRHDDDALRRAQPLAEASRPGASDGAAAAPDPTPDGITDDELRELVGGGTLSEALAPSADWKDIEAPLSPYAAVLRLGGQP